MTRIRSSKGGQGWLDIHEDVVQSYIRSGGDVADLLDSVAWDTAEYGKAYVSAGHVRSGRLLRGIYYNRIKPTGPLTGYSRAGGKARHTIYFHEGVLHDITAHGAFMVIPRSRLAANTNAAYSGAGAERYAKYAATKKGPKGVIGRKTVRGQRSKPFLKEGLAVALANHGLK